MATDIKIGDVMRVRQWDDMAKDALHVDEYSIRFSDNDILFSVRMRGICGRIFTVSDINTSLVGTPIYSSLERVEGIEGEPWTYWITANMLEPYEDDEDFECATDDEISVLLS